MLQLRASLTVEKIAVSCFLVQMQGVHMRNTIGWNWDSVNQRIATYFVDRMLYILERTHVICRHFVPVPPSKRNTEESLSSAALRKRTELADIMDTQVLLSTGQCNLHEQHSFNWTVRH